MVSRGDFGGFWRGFWWFLGGFLVVSGGDFLEREIWGGGEEAGV